MLFRSYFYAMAAAVLWATSGVVGKKLFSTGVTPIHLVQVRSMVAVLLLALFLFLRHRPLLRLDRWDIPYFALLGVVMAGGQWTYFFAISRIQVAAAILLQYFAPFFIAAFAVIFWKERITIPKAAALLLALGGSYLVAGGYDLRLLEMNRLGIIVALSSAVCFGTFSLLGERGMHRYSPWTVITLTMFFTAIVLNAAHAPFGYLKSGYGPVQWGGLFYVGILGTAVPFGLYLESVSHLRATRASITATLEPIAAGLLAYAFLGEIMEWPQVLGALTVIAAIIILQLSREGTEGSPESIRSQRADRGIFTPPG